MFLQPLQTDAQEQRLRLASPAHSALTPPQPMFLLVVSDLPLMPAVPAARSPSCPLCPHPSLTTPTLEIPELRDGPESTEPAEVSV